MHRLISENLSLQKFLILQYINFISRCQNDRDVILHVFKVHIEHSSFLFEHIYAHYFTKLQKLQMEKSIDAAITQWGEDQVVEQTGNWELEPQVLTH